MCYSVCSAQPAACAECAQYTLAAIFIIILLILRIDRNGERERQPLICCSTD